MHLHIEFGQTDPTILSFKIRDSELAQKWVNKVKLAQKIGYKIDEPDRYYGFETINDAQSRALQHLELQIKTINAFSPIIHRKMQDVHDQDCLNYLHNVFERYHGLLDQQTHPFWNSAPVDVKKALATLNTAVHRCESASRFNPQRAVVTYYGLPKNSVLDNKDYQLREDNWKFGTVNLCYVEIGKTLFDLSVDNDKYISNEAFQPFMHYSADFVIQFNKSDADQHALLIEKMWEYFDQHKSFFESNGYSKYHPMLEFGIFPVADIDTSFKPDQIIELIKHKQYTNQVWFT